MSKKVADIGQPLGAPDRITKGGCNGSAPCLGPPAFDTDVIARARGAFARIARLYGQRIDAQVRNINVADLSSRNRLQRDSYQ